MSELKPSILETLSRLKVVISPGTVGDISIPVGWSALFRVAVDRITLLPAEIRSGVCIHQIKEKHGTFRIYAYAPDEFFDITNAVELSSNAICGICGAAGCLRIRGWGSVRCDSHRAGQEPFFRRLRLYEDQVGRALALLSSALGRDISKAEFERVANLKIDEPI